MSSDNMIMDRKYQRGFALLEVLIAVIVLALGLMALASFQGGMLRSGSDAKNRTIATTIAQGELEAIRNGDNDKDGNVDVDDYLAIVGVDRAPVTVADANTTFFVTREVTNYYFAGANQAASTTTSAGATAPDYKLVEVTVDWADEEGANQEISVQGYINASLLTHSGSTLAFSSAQASPSLSYTPGSVPDVVSLDLTIDPDNTPSNNFQEASTPIPEVNDQSGTTQVSFEEITYEDGNASSTIINRDENLTMNCVCRLGRSDSQVGLTPAVFDVAGDIIGDEKWIHGSAIADKTVGRAATGTVTVQGANLNLRKQPELCDICCRDHHDGGTDNDTYYDPFRHTGMGDHEHYFYDQNNALQPITANGELYLEACRFVRVDGLWRVVQDWRLEGLQVLPEDFLNDSVNLDAYRKYLRQFVKEYILAIDSNYPSVTPDSSTFTASNFTTALAGLPNAGEAGDEVSMSVGDTKQFITRGLYIDYMDSELINRFKCKLGSGSDCNDVSQSDDFLAEVPFHEVNLTYLANWYPGQTAIYMKSEPIKLDNSGNRNYNRGLAEALQNGNDLAKAVIERSNSGIIDGNIVDNNGLQPNADTLTLADSLDMIVGSGGDIATYTVSGTIIINANAGFGTEIQNSDIIVETSVTDATCGLTGSDSNGNPTYSCSYPTTESNINITLSNYNFNEDCTPTDNNDNNFAVFNNKAQKDSGGQNPSSSSVALGATISESTTFTFSMGDTSINYTANFKISKDGNGSSC